MENLITLEIEEDKREFLIELLDNFDFVEVQDNSIWKEIVEAEKIIEMKKEEDKKPKRFTDFSLQDVKEMFELEEKEANLFEGIEGITPSEWLKESLKKSEDRKLNNEKIRSEALVYPVCCEVESISKHTIRLFSGENVNFNEEKGLKGELDFAFTPKKTAYLEAPIFTIIEAKNADINKHWGQIAAQMVGAKEENAKEGNDLKAIFGCISTGEDWKFVKLENNVISIDKKYYSIYWELEKILGIFQYIVDFYKKPPIPKGSK